MAQPDPTPNWLAWIVPIGVGAGIVWAAVKHYFELVTRPELVRLMEAQDGKFLEAMAELRADFERDRTEDREEQRRLHGENVATARETFVRVSDLEKGVSRIEGTLSGRYMRPNAR